tara:strand:- start:144 stop:1376 length:1233 start_codon:yes stop_codon:yes gene_type:complete
MELFKSSIITIGDELVSGFRTDTNSTWIASQLHLINIDVHSIHSVPDNLKQIIESLQLQISLKIDYVFITGGLGPTNDDKTLESVKKFLGSNYFLDENYSLYLKSKFKNIEYRDMIKNQSTKIDGVNYLFNPKGSALPFYFTKNNTTFFVMPGVPIEMKNIFKNQIKSLIDKKSKKRITANLLTSGLGESLLSNKINDIIKTYSKNIKFSFLPNYGGVVVRLESIDSDKKLFKEVKNNIKKKFNKYFVTEDDISLPEYVLKLLSEKELNLSIAESCTGGFMSKIITDFSGSSKIFKGSVIAYSNEIKEKILKIPSQILLKHGAVSEMTSIKMCKSVNDIFKTDISVSTTGISGPEGGSVEKPVGLVYISVMFENDIITKKFIFNRDRDINRKITISAALNMIRELVLRKK